MKMDLQLLNKLRACSPAVQRYKAAGQPDSVEKYLELLLTDEDQENCLNYALWLLPNVLDVDNCRRYAIFAAEQILPIFEAAYPEDKRPRLAIEAAEKYPL